MRFTRVLMFAAVAAMSLVSCNDEFDGMEVYDPSGDKSVYDGDLAMKCARGQMSVSYKLETSETFKMDDLTKGKWVKLEDMDGYMTCFPSSICFYKGSVCTPLRSFAPSGPTVFHMFLGYYCRMTTKDVTVYIKRDFEINPTDGKMLIADIDFDFKGFEDEGMTLSYQNNFTGGRTGKGGKYLNIAEYKAFPLSPDNDGDLIFDSVPDAYNWLIDECTDLFGESIDMNNGQTDVIYDYPVMKINLLRDELEFRLKHNDMF